MFIQTNALKFMAMSSEFSEILLLSSERTMERVMGT